MRLAPESRQAFQTGTGVTNRDKRKGRTIPPWIRKRSEIESEVREGAESLGIKPPARPGTREHTQIIESLIEQGEKRREKELHNSPPIPF